MRIHILGGPGSGKTYIANLLSTKMKINSYDLDDINWDKTAKFYGIRNTVEKRKKLLKEILKKPKWIIEGVYFDWTDLSFEKADKIIVINPKLRTQLYRIIVRSIKRKFGKAKEPKKENFKNICRLIKWTIMSHKKQHLKMMETLYKYDDKLFVVTKNEEILNILDLGKR